MSYYLSKITDYDFEKALVRVEEELKAEGFGILTEIDVQSTLKKKLDVDYKKYKILGACNPPLAYKALTSEDKIGVMLPCNVIVEENNENKIEVAMINPFEAMQGVKNEKLSAIALEVSKKLETVLEKI